MAELLEPIHESDRTKWIRNILNNIQTQGIETLNVERRHLEIAIRHCTSQGLQDGESTFSVINAFDIPRFKFDAERKKFLLDTQKRSIMPDCSMKAGYIADRYTILYQRTARHHLFAPKLDGPTFTLKKVEQLLATSKSAEIVVLGLLTQLSEGKFYIEDPTGVLPVDITNASFHSGLFCEGCFVLAEGIYYDGMMKVSALGFPPPELATSSRAFFGTANTWGGPSQILLKYSKNLEEFEKKNDADGFIFISDIWLDVPEVMQKLKILLDGFDEYPPIAIILMGPFLKNYDDVYSLKKKLNEFGTLLEATTRLKRETYFVFVPAAEDPVSINVFPRPPLPESLTQDLRKKHPKVIMGTNPCRIQYCTQQIVVCRIELVTKLCRNAVKFPTSGTLDDHFSRTLLSQGTLAPLHPVALPILWEYDASMLLYPLPDVIVVGDPSNSFHVQHNECTVINTGSFPKSKFAFKMYNAAQKTVEDSQLPDQID